jgi:type VI secretion system Hcp family effector
MSMQSFLQIQAGGEDLPVEFGEDTTTNAQGGTDVSAWLECSEFEVALETIQSAATAPARVGQRTWRPARFVLRMGKSTPILFDACRTNRRIDLTLHFFRPHHETGEIEEHFRYSIKQGRVASVRIVQPSSLDATAAGLPNHVELRILPRISEVESVTGSTMMIDEWMS